MNTPLVVLVAHADRLVSEALAVAVDQHSAMRAARDRPHAGAGLAHAVRDACPDVAVIGDPLTDMGGAVATRVALAAQADLRVVLVAHECLPERARAAMAAGAVGCLAQDLDVDELVNAVRRVGEGERPVLDPSLAGLVDQGPEAAGPDDDLATRLAQLAPRQLEILQYMGAGLTAHQMSKRTGLADATIRSHIRGVLDRLGVRSQVEAVAVARKLDAIR